MNGIPIELCERKNYVKTTQELVKTIKKRGPFRRLDDFTKFLKEERKNNKENIKYKGKLSFDVSSRISSFFQFGTLDSFGRRRLKGSCC